MDSAPPYLSVVVPCFNEEPVLPALYARLSAACRAAGRPYELVLVNDGSTDGTWPAVAALAAADPWVVGVNLSRNYGHQIALTAGLASARGDRVLVIDADLQDPPEALPDMLAEMDRAGADVVYGRRAARRGETWFKRATAHLFYRLLDRLADCPIPHDAGDFRLVTRRVVAALLAMPERHRFVRGQVSWVGFKQVPYFYDRHPRAAGETHYSLGRMVRLAWDAVTGFSTRPLALPLPAAAGCVGAAILCWTAAAVWWTAGNGVPTVGLLAGLLFALGAGQFLALGLIGQYLGRMYTEVRGRPLYVVDQVVRADTPATLPHPAADRRAA